MLKDSIQNLLGQVREMNAANAEELEALRIKYLSKKGEITTLFNEFRTVPSEQKRRLSRIAHQTLDNKPVQKSFFSAKHNEYLLEERRTDDKIYRYIFFTRGQVLLMRILAEKQKLSLFELDSLAVDYMAAVSAAHIYNFYIIVCMLRKARGTCIGSDGDKLIFIEEAAAFNKYMVASDRCAQRKSRRVQSC